MLASRDERYLFKQLNYLLKLSLFENYFHDSLIIKLHINVFSQKSSLNLNEYILLLASYS